MFKKISLLIALALSTNALAKGGVSPYLPLNQAPELEHNVERLLAVSKNTHIMSKPYKTKDIYRVLQAIRYSYPELYHSLSYQINPHIQSSAVTQAKITLSVGTKEKKIPNQRGQSTKTNLILEGNTYSNFNQYLGVSFGGIANEEGIIPTQSILYLGFEYAQIDIGYREHWYSPFHNSAMLLSTHAEAPPSISISNVKPISDFNIRYDIFISQLSEQKGILKNKRVYHLTDPYLGPSYTNEEIKKFLDDNKITYREFKSDDALVKGTAKLIFENNVIGWFQKGMEWGPRALGGRSILSSPTNKNMQEIAAAEIKKANERKERETKTDDDDNS